MNSEEFVNLDIINIYKHKNPRFRNKIAGFDFDHTIVIPKEGRTFPINRSDWRWLNSNVTNKIKKMYESGYMIVIFTNQTKAFKHLMIKDVIKELDLPITVVVGNKIHKKPDRIMYDTLFKGKWQKYADKVKLDKSVYIGDAAGRQEDFSDSDKVFAENIGFAYKTPEEVFYNYDNKQKTAVNTSDDIYIRDINNQEIIIMIGYMASGKSSFVTKHFEPFGYFRIDGDKYKTSKAMNKEAKKRLEEGKSVVYDATNGTKQRRKEILDLAQSLNIPVRCFHITTNIEKAMDNNRIRAAQTGKSIPKIAFYRYRKSYEAVSEDECQVISIDIDFGES